VSPVDTLEINLRENLELPEDAIRWLLDLWVMIQTFDDIADGDEIDRASLDATILSSLTGFQANPFYLRHQSWLLPAMTQAVLKWMASDTAERAGQADERSFMWRAGYYDVILLVVYRVHGPDTEKAWAALRMYGETAEEYMREFSPDA
jgi:hypothetical protein